jgi:hypothetical protein
MLEVSTDAALFQAIPEFRPDGWDCRNGFIVWEIISKSAGAGMYDFDKQNKLPAIFMFYKKRTKRSSGMDSTDVQILSKAVKQR